MRFTNNGFGTASADENNAECNADPDTLNVLQNGQFVIPQCIINEIQADAAAGNGRTDAIDPNLDIPSTVRGSFGFSHFTNFGGAAGGFFDDWNVNVDFIYSANRNAFDFVDLTLAPTSVAPDGRPIFSGIDPLQAGCNATFIGPRDGFSNITSDCFTGRDQDILLTNVADGVNDGRSISISAQFAKTFDYTLFNNPASTSINLGYAYTDATQVVGSLSSTATSNFEEVAVISPNQPFAAPSQFVNPHVLSLATSFRQEIFRELPTTLSFFVQARQGQPFSYVFDDDTSEDIFGDSDDEARTLLFVPTDENDSRFDFSNLTAEQTFALFNFISESGLSEFAGGFAPRNEFNDPWFVDVDFRFQQDLPDFVDGLRTIFFVDIENLLNIIDDDLNDLRTFDRGNTREGVPVFGIDSINSAGQFVIGNNNGSGALESQLTGTDGFDLNPGASLWSVQFGLRFEF